MKHKLLLKTLCLRATLLVTLLCILCANSVWGQQSQEVTITMSEQGWSDSSAIGSGTLKSNATTNSIFTYSSGTGDDGANAGPKYFDSGTNVRFYTKRNGTGKGNWMQINVPGNTTITGVEISGVSGNTPSVKYNIDEGDDVSWTASSNTYTVSGISATSSFKFRNAVTGNSTAQLRITSIKITYTTSGSGSTAEATTTTIDATGITNNLYNGTNAGTLTASVVDSEDNAVDGASVTWSSSNTDVATVGETTGVVTLVAAGKTTITASYAGVEDVYQSSSDTYELTVIHEDPNLVTIWSEDFATSGYSDRSSTYSYAVTNSSAVQNSDSYAGGTAPEMMVKANGTYSATIPLLTSTYGYSGDLTLTYKTNAKSLNVKSNTSGITVDGEANEGEGLTFNTNGTHTVTFKGTTVEKANISIIFTAGSDNVRLDDIVLKGTQEKLSTVATPTFSPGNGTAVATGTEISISCATEGASIYYTIGASPADPTSSSTPYNPDNKPSITEATTIKAIAIKAGLTNSSIASASYTIAEPCATPTFSIPEGEVEKGTSVTISTETAGATIYYTTNGTNPTTSSSVYSSALTINTTQTIKAIAVKDGYANSAVASATYTVIDYATLPFSYTGNGGGTSNVTGLKPTSLANYNTAPLIKFDASDDALELKLNEAPKCLSFDIKGMGNGTWSGTFDVLTSTDGENYSTLKQFTSLSTSDTQNEVFVLASTVRYIKWVFTSKTTGFNVALGDIRVNYETVTIGETGWATYVAPYNVSFEEEDDIEVDIVIEETGVVRRVAVEGKQVPQSKTVLLYASDSKRAYVPIIASATALSTDNKLKASNGSVTATVSDKFYGLAVKNEKIGFYRVNTGVTIPSGKGYLDLTGVSLAPQFIWFDDETTGIDSLNADTDETNDGSIYDLSGRRITNGQSSMVNVQSLPKGIYIQNGKKFIVK